MAGARRKGGRAEYVGGLPAVNLSQTSERTGLSAALGPARNASPAAGCYREGELVAVNGRRSARAQEPPHERCG